MFSAPGHVFGDTDGVRSRFHIFHSRTCFRLYQGRGVPFSCFALPDKFSTVPRLSGPVFMFCALGHVFGGTEGVGSRFHVLRARIHFWRYKGLRVPISALSDIFPAVPWAWVPFSYFALPDSFSAVPWAWVPFSYFAHLNSLSAVPWASGPVFVFFAPGFFFGGTDGVKSHCHAFRSRTCFRRYRGRRVLFSCSALSDSFSAVPRASGPFFMFCAPGLIFEGTEGVRSHFLILRVRTHFRRYRGCRVPFSCFVLPNTFSKVPRAWGPIFMFWAPELIFGRTEGVSFCFHVFRYRTCFRRYRGRRVPFSCSARPDLFSAVPRATGLISMFCAPGYFFGGTKGVKCRFHILRSRTSFRRYRGRRVPFS
jgi:hypothetical protein